MIPQDDKDMMYVANVETKEILFRVDAWDCDCESKAVAFIKENKLRVKDDVITVNGDRIVWVF